MTRTAPDHVLIVGVTSRALAVSASRAGYRVTAVDPFGDLDLRAVAEVITVGRGNHRKFNPLAAATRAGSVPAPMVAYTSNLENSPPAVSRLAAGRTLLGNSARVLTRVRNPLALMQILEQNGFCTPDTRATPASRSPKSEKWLLKPRRSGGGHGITAWRSGSPVPRGSYLQRWVPGIPGSAVFAADGKRAVLLGLTRQLIGDAQLGARGFRYCGSILHSSRAALFSNQAQLFRTAAELADVVTREFGLVGLNGIDFIAHEGIPYPLEVNPRYSASMELLERAHGMSVFDVHIQACRGVLPAAPPPPDMVHGKAIVFARRNITMGDTLGWLGKPFADIPHPGEAIRRGHPICTVFAASRTAPACERLLVRRAAAVHRMAEADRQAA